MSVPPPISLHHTSPFSHTQQKKPSILKINKNQIWQKTHTQKCTFNNPPAFGNATGISSSSLHFPKKMNLNNDSNIVLPRIKNISTTTQACAACKYQRRKCEPNCILSPYLPHNRQAQFLNAHKLFGVSNITKIIRDLSHADKDQAMKTILFQSDVRANDPVGGCYRIIKELQFMIEYYQAELDLVMHQLSIFRAQHHAQAQTATNDQQGNNDPQYPQFLRFMTSNQTVNNNCSNPNSEAINADPLSAYSPSSLQCSYQQQLQHEQLNLQLGGIISHREREEDNFILVNDENNCYEGSVQENATINSTWVRHDKDEEEEEQERMVNYCVDENEEDRYNSRGSFDDYKKDMSSSFESCNKLKFDFEEDHKGGSRKILMYLKEEVDLVEF